ncbi:MAG: DUF6519 domain-containing protein [bacterium]|nr:DUF6519 domain-containing protein [bacterium]
MKTDISRDTFRREKHYSAVRLKQNRLLTDADWNEQVDIQNYIRRTKLRDTYGASGVPISGGGFQVGATGADLSISAGSIYVDGILCENFADSVFTNQIDLPGQSLPEDGLYLAYLDVWERSVSSIEANIREAGLGGPDTGTRAQLLNQVKLLYIGDGSVDAARFDTPPEFTALTQAQRGRISARTRAADVGTDPCDIGERGGYSSQENRLYRVEIHTAGGVAGGGQPATATFKWSRDNGTVASELLEINGTSLSVRSTGRDRAISFRAGDWLEVSDEGREKAGEPGTLARVQEIVGETIIIDPDSLRHFDGLEGDAKVLSLADFSRGTARIRRWDMNDAVGAAPLPSAGVWFELENGIEVLFEDDAFSVGDYWLIPARAATRNVEWPRDEFGGAIPQIAGPEHSYAPLAYVRSLGGVWENRADLRTELAVLTRPELFYVSGDGQQGMPGEDLDTALAVRVGSGPETIAGAKVRFEILTGTGTLRDAPGGVDLGAITIVETDADGRAAVGWRLDATNEHQRVQAMLLNSDGSDSSYLVRYNANLNLSSAVHYTGDVPGPDAQNLLDGVSTVDEAIDRLGEIKVNRAGDTITGSLIVQQDFDLNGDLTVRGDVIVQDTNSLPGSIDLGNADEDDIIIHAELDSGHTTDRLVVDDTLRVQEDLDVEGRIGVGTSAPTDKLSAAGLVETLEGGLVFPDGTIQTTAGAEGGGGVPTGYCVPGPSLVAPDGFVDSSRAINAGGQYAAWTPLASMTIARQRPAVAVLNGRIYVAGGSRGGAGGGGRTEHEEYDPLTNLWRNRAALPAANGQLASAVYRDRMYVFGGSTWSGSTLTGVTDTTRVYDPTTDAWTSLAALPTPRSNGSAVAVDGRIYVIGGDSNPSSGVALSANEAFDPDANAWSVRADMPTARTNSAVAVLNDRVYVFGGNQVTNAGLNALEVYDPAADSWTTRAPMPFSGFGMIAAVVDHRIHVIGGISGGADLNIYKIYDPATDSWSDGPTGMSLRHNGAGAVVHNTIYYLTGQVQGPAGDVTTNEAYSPAIYFAAQCKSDAVVPPAPAPAPFQLDWTAIAALPSDRVGGVAATVNDRAYYIGGDDAGAAATASLYEYDPAQDLWTQRASAPGARTYAAGVVHDDRIYVFAGIQNGVIQTASDVYDPVRNEWSSLEPIPSSRFYVGAAKTLSGRIFVVGGRDSGGTGLPTNEEYDPVADAWSTRQAMSVGREALAVVAVDEKIYAIGGVNGATIYGTNEVYDPATNVWTTLQPMPTARYAVSAVSMNGKIYTFGGFTSSGNTNVVEEYDPRTDTWRAVDSLASARRYTAATVVGRTAFVLGGFVSGAITSVEAISLPASTTRIPLPAPRASHVVQAVDSKLYVTAGYGAPGDDAPAATYEYDPAVNAWATRAAIPTPRYEAASAVAGGRLFVITGGVGPATFLDANEEYDPVTNQWTARAAIPTARRDAAATGDGTSIYVTGGAASGSVFDTLNIYSVAGDSWSAGAPMPTARRGHVAVFVDGLMYVIGGSLSGGALTGVNQAYDPGTDSWSTLAPSPIPRDKASVFARAGRIYIVGGRTSNASAAGSSIVEEYNPATNAWRRMPDILFPRGYNQAALIGDRAHIVGGQDGPLATVDHQLIQFEN